MQPQPKDDESSKSSPEEPNVKVTRSEKWIIRKRQANGTLKHLQTLTFRPTKNDLVAFGPGEYSLQKSAGGRFSKSEKITVDGTPHRPHSRGLPALDQGSGRTDRFPTTNYRRPSQAAEELSPSSTTRTGVARREKTVSDRTKPPGRQMESNRPTSADDRSLLSTHDGMKQAAKTIPKTRRTLLDREVKSVPAVGAKSKSATASKRETQEHESVGSNGGRLQSKSQPERRPEDAHSVNLPEDVRVKDGYSVPSQAPTTNWASVPEPTKEKKYISCAKCGDTICEEDELWRFNHNGKRCEYCATEYCDECFPQHICSSSELCTYCDRRFSNEFVAVAQYCRKKYCSPQCVNLCFAKNKDRPECWGCGDREEDTEDTEESDQDENVEEDTQCIDCAISIEYDERSNYVCMDCENEDSFCSRLCFNLYHKRKGWDHEGMTFGEYDDQPEESSRKSKVRVIRKRGKVTVIEK
jgi:hypothetical protein